MKILTLFTFFYLCFFPFVTFASDDVCEKYPRLEACICETIKNDLTTAMKVFFLFKILEDDIANTEVFKVAAAIQKAEYMVKVQNVIAQASHVASKKFNDSVRYKCYNQTHKCDEALKELSKSNVYLSEAAKAASKVITSSFDYIAAEIESNTATQKAKQAKERSNFYFYRSTAHHNRQKADILSQRAEHAIKHAKKARDTLRLALSDYEVFSMKSRNFVKAKKDFEDYCIEIKNEKTLEEIINAEGLEKIEI